MGRGTLQDEESFHKREYLPALPDPPQEEILSTIVKAPSFATLDVTDPQKPFNAPRFVLVSVHRAPRLGLVSHARRRFAVNCSEYLGKGHYGLLSRRFR